MRFQETAHGQLHAVRNHQAPMNIPAGQGPISALRGTLVFCRDDPFLTDPGNAFVSEPDGLVICRDGVIDAVGPYARHESRSCRRTPTWPTIRAA